MARHFEFTESVKKEARLRQKGFCAHCGDSLNWQWEEAHHVVPDQCGLKDDDKHHWLKTTLNCVVLCGACHFEIGHGGNTKTGIIAGPEAYQHSHAGDTVQHACWVQLVNLEAEKVFGRQLPGRREDKWKVSP
jgi:hypothetical protein